MRTISVEMGKPKYSYEAGFVGSGVVSRTFLAGLRTLRGTLGPVYSPTRRATPRVVRALRAGFTAEALDAMKGCRNLFVCAPAEETPSLLAEAARAEVFAGVDTLVLVESSSTTFVCDSIRNQLREVGAIAQLPTRIEPSFLLEGSLRFRRFCQQLLGVPLRRLVMATPGSRSKVDAGLFMAEEFSLPLLEAIQSAFSLAGIAHDQARELGAELLGEAVESARFAGRKRWTGILHHEDRHRLNEIVAALEKENDLIARLVLGFTRESLAMMGKDTGWIDGLRVVTNRRSLSKKAEDGLVIGD